MSRKSISKRLPHIPGHLLRRPRDKNAGVSIHNQPRQQKRLLAYPALDINTSASAVRIRPGKRGLQREVTRLAKLRPVVFVKEVLVSEPAENATQQLFFVLQVPNCIYGCLRGVVI